MQFFDTTIETPTRNALGSMLIALTVILILLNLSFIIYQVKVTVWKRLVKMMADKNEMAKLKEKADAQTNIATGNDVNSDIEIFESVKFCKYWHSHRKWLKANNIDTNKFPEEDKYQTILNKMKLQHLVKY